jgi:hypothetical protein
MAPVNIEHIHLSNNRLKLAARPVTALASGPAGLSLALAKARAAPVHAAA